MPNDIMQFVSIKTGQCFSDLSTCFDGNFHHRQFIVLSVKSILHVCRFILFNITTLLRMMQVKQARV